MGNAIAIAGTILAAVTAVVALIIQAIRGSSPSEYHNRQTCMCYDCRMARYRGMKARGVRPISVDETGAVIWSDEVPTETRDNLSTVELTPWRVVRVFDKKYRVEAVDKKPDGYRVFLRNMETRARFFVTIAYGNEHRRYWKPEGWAK
jgi:hypothetical protein